jgi:peptidoglycan/LPS O-acetylase OafA/YrhL
MKNRILILDGFRALAIISVIFFHFFSRWIPPRKSVSLYPYNNAYDFFSLGYLGVQFFFIISGFVIFFTLDNTKDFGSFWKKRLIRLIPSILIASVVTLILFKIFDSQFLFPHSHELKNFIPSITFISPVLLNDIFKGCDFNYINGSYWSLWPEIQFYIFSSLIFYFKKEKFLVNFLLISIGIIFINFVLTTFQSRIIHLGFLTPTFFQSYKVWINNEINLIIYLPFFSIGVLFYLLFKNNNFKLSTPIFIKICFAVLILFAIYSGKSTNIRIIYLFMFLLFFVFIYFPEKLKFFEHKVITNIGGSSYFLYLIHENLGVFIIFSIGQYFMSLGFMLPLMLIVIFIVISNLYTSSLDKRMTGWLKNKILKK